MGVTCVHTDYSKSAGNIKPQYKMAITMEAGKM